MILLSGHVKPEIFCLSPGEGANHETVIDLNLDFPQKPSSKFVLPSNGSREVKGGINESRLKQKTSYPILTLQVSVI